MSKRHLEKDDSLATPLNGVHYICFPLYFVVHKSRTIVSRFSKRWMICRTFNDLQLRSTMYFNYVEWFYYIEWFALNLIFYTCNVKCVLTKLKDLHCCWLIWSVQWNFLLENIPQKTASEFPLPWKSQQWALPQEKDPLVETSPVIIALQQMKKTIFKI